jgi:hypothetical protein
MKKFSLFSLSVIMLLTAGCEGNVPDQTVKIPNVIGQASISIVGDGMVTTRSTGGRVEFTGGYATGAGLYDGEGYAEVKAIPYSGYQLVSFTGGKVSGNLSQYTGSSQYGFKIEQSDWQFKVSFKKKIDLRFIAVGENGNILYYDKGDVTLRQVGDVLWRSLAYGNGKYVAVGVNGSYGKVAYSTDGLNWTASDIPDVLALYGITYGGGKFVTVGWSQLAYSYDGTNWTRTNVGHKNYNNLQGVAYGNGKFVAVGTAGHNYTTFAYSSDGINWSEVDMDAALYDVVFANGRFVTVGNSYCFYSANGVNWNSATLIGTYQSIAYGSSKFVAVGNNGRVAYSSDGSSWTAKTLMGGVKSWSFFAVTYAIDKFIAIGTNGNLAYSSDGINWETIKTERNVTFRSICPIY